MLSAADRKFICENYRNLSMRAIGLRLGVDGKTVKKAIIQAGLTPKKTKSEIRKETGYACNPPESCFNCPFNDCIRDVFQVKQTSKEIEYHALGGIDTVGQGNGRRRV